MKKLVVLMLLAFLNSVNTANATIENKGENNPMEKITQMAGRTQLGNFAPDFAHFHDDVLFGENWNNQDIDTKTRGIITMTALISQGIADNSLKHHLQNAKNHGVTQKETAAVKHWHGAALDSWFSHIAVEIDGEATENVWLEAVTDEEYNKLK